MTSPEPDFDSLVDALRADLPSTQDERRVRKRLLAAGVGVTTSLVAPGATASGLVAGSSLPAALLQKLGALSWTVKVGLASVAATAALPAAVYLTRATPSSTAPEVGPLDQPVPARSVRRNPATLSIAVPSVPAAATAVDSSAARQPSHAAPESVSRPPDPTGAEVKGPSDSASSAAFPVDDEADGAEARSTLAEETVLVERALYALRRGDRDGARRVLEEHARRFPNGLLARERDRALSRANAAGEPDSPTAPE